MTRIHVFADEAGNFDFSQHAGASKCFILTTVAMEDCSPGARLLELRRDLPWRGVQQVTSDFHASEEAQAVRDHVFAELAGCHFRVDASVWEKRKVQPHLVSAPERFYKTVAYFHFKQVIRAVSRPGDELMISIASIGTKRRRSAYRKALDDVLDQSSAGRTQKLGFWSCASDPCLWIADYCSWAIQRKWERRDERSHKLIESKIATEFEFTQKSDATFY